MREEEENTNRKINKVKVGETVVTANGKEEKKKYRRVYERRNILRGLCTDEEIQKTTREEKEIQITMYGGGNKEDYMRGKGGSDVWMKKKEKETVAKMRKAKRRRRRGVTQKKIQI